jgi:hypothetical protein
MSKRLSIAVLAAVLLIGACTQGQQQGGGTAGGGATGQPNEVSDAQTQAAGICGFVPTVATILGILNLGNPAFATGAQIAKLICDTLTGSGTAGDQAILGRGDVTATVGGEVVTIAGAPATPEQIAQGKRALAQNPQ